MTNFYHVIHLDPNLKNETIYIYIYIYIRVLQAPQNLTIEPDFFLVVRLMVSNICVKLNENWIHF